VCPQEGEKFAFDTKKVVVLEGKKENARARKDHASGGHRTHGEKGKMQPVNAKRATEKKKRPVCAQDSLRKYDTIPLPKSLKRKGRAVSPEFVRTEKGGKKTAAQHLHWRRPPPGTWEAPSIWCRKEKEKT